MNRLLLLSLIAVFSVCVDAAKKKGLDYSIVFVPEEGGVKFEKITEDADAVDGTNLVGKSTSIFGSKKTNTMDWWVLPMIGVSPDGKRVGYINDKNGTKNIMVKNASKGGAS
ncbi:MAG: hypothetical protein IJ199_10620, partial [Prevotella sp.]|nr:hypothetical protein [Prevotella sp.]